MLSKAKVFKDGFGNRMIFPAYIYDEGEDTPSETTFWTTGLQIKAATGMEMETEWFEFDRSNFAHIKTEIGSSGFAHGSEKVLLFDGPEFHEILERRPAEDPEPDHG